MTQINLIEQIYPLNGDHRIQTVKPKWLPLEGAGHYFSRTAYNLTFKPPCRGKGLKKDIS